MFHNGIDSQKRKNNTDKDAVLQTLQSLYF